MAAAHVVRSSGGEVCSLGVIQMRVLADAAASQGSLTVLEFRGGEGPWTVPHAHHQMEESFYVLEGSFDVAVGNEDLTLHQGDYVLVPRGTSHMITAHRGGGTLLGINSPAGLEDMFRELSRLEPDSLRNPETRRRISARFDSVPV